MAALLAEPWAGLLGLAALLLWPGLLVVRAPWPFVPFLSLAFWLASWGFLSPAGPGRHRFLIVTLAFSALLSGLRLLKPFEASRPSGPTLAMLAMALGRLVPSFLWPAAPGLDAGFTSASTLLLVWRDGLPASYVPLYPILGFGLGDAGLAALAADVSLLTGTVPHRALLLATLASEGLLILALFALARRSWPETGSGAATGALAGATAFLLGWSRWDGEGGTVLAMALATCGSSLVVRACGRSPRVAAGLLWAGAAALSPLVALAGGVATGLALATTGGWRALGRLALPVALAGALSAPWLWRILDAGRFAAPKPLTLLLVVAIALSVGAARSYRLGPRAFPLVVAIALAATLADWGWRSAEVRVTADDLAAAHWLRSHSGATDTVCAQDEAARAWIPALAGRAAIPPRWPESVRAARLAARLPACGFVWSEDASPLAPAAFREGRVSVSPMPSPGSAPGR